MKYFLHTSIKSNQICAHGKLRSYLLLYCACLLLLLAACGNSSHAQGTSTIERTQRSTPTFVRSNVRVQKPGAFAEISFTSSTSYATALRLVTGLGLQLSALCQIAQTNNQGKIVAALPWSPIGNKENFKTSNETYTHGTIGKAPTVTVVTVLPSLLVSTTVLAPSDWQARLQASPAVSYIDTQVRYNCPAMGPVTPGKITSIAPQQTGTDVIVTFAGTDLSYDDALNISSAMGFRLAAPCYERETSKPNNWHPMDQQKTFADTHTLTLATTNMSPTNWQTRIVHTSQIKRIDILDKVTC